MYADKTKAYSSKKDRKRRKTDAENISNCEKYWSHGFGKDPARCTTPNVYGKDFTGEINYPGRAKQLLGYKPTTKPTATEKKYLQRNEYDW